jgi:hypothetical protein
MNGRNRREFLEDVGRGMLLASLGSATAWELGLSPAVADEPNPRLTFGELEPLVSLMQETSPDQLLPLLVDKMRAGTQLKTLVTSAALANVRAFGGQDYTGYHTFMALVPAWQMANELSSERAALPVLKVLYRNSSRIQEQGADRRDAIDWIEAAEPVQYAYDGQSLRDAVRAVDWQRAEAQFASLAKGPLGEAYNHLQFAVQEEVDVHRVVLAWRAWAMVGLTADEHAHTLLRQSVRYCLQTEEHLRERNGAPSPVRDLLPRLLDEYQLLAHPGGDRAVDDAWIDDMSRTIFSATRADAGEAVASALAEGIDPEVIGEAISCAANLLVLHDPGRREQYSTPQKPPGCVHGDSVGVHASDAANAWRNIARVSNPRNRMASLIVAAYHTAGQTSMTTPEPFAYSDLQDEITAVELADLLGLANEAIQSNDQALACAVADRYGQLNLHSRPMFDLFLNYAVSEDGALHAEKYYRTVTEEFSTTRPAFRGRQLVALARVTASEHGFPAPGYQQACELLGIS